MNCDVVKRGTAIYTKKPFVFTLNEKHRTTRCDNCLKSGKLLKCSSCQYVYYCDRSCQKESWPIHKVECPRLKKVVAQWKIMPDAARLMARIILKLKQGGANEVDYYTETNFRKFKDLMSHYSDIKKDTKRLEHFTTLCAVLYEFLGETLIPNVAELMGIYGRICTNCFNILDINMNTIAAGIYLGPSVMDHSCKPNSVAVFEGTTIVIRTLVDLPCLDWSQIRISYVDLLNSNKDRREELHSSYYFLCDCEKCKQPDPMAEATACPNSLCDSPCLIDAEECEKCGTKLSKEFKEKFREVTDFTAHNLEKMKTMAYLDISKMCLEKQKNILHRFNVQHVRTLEAAHIAAMNLECWEDAEFYGKELMPGYLLYYGEIHPLTGLLYLTIGKIQLHLRKSEEAFKALINANSVLMITHGEMHSLVKEELRPLLYQATTEQLSNIHNGM
ncbi:histone-lysine N-methyltransferase SMYD3 isoform X2 [Linepithema humile]|uniref:histone-lysine N-methyltransferase SMYD3 isoform X2 n=1 Tax=Linepithema humile TaxID=83485 RepID=UPI0006238C82|nr:PREDICTED: histone-lysine N-methyltransferase SMYD3 isoform X2 [Linepithema humile]XP_012216258.1 PREDICTED: histone-lysine N-methyltransferase SMYD3 isoform X2 [Linepithema humile]